MDFLTIRATNYHQFRNYFSLFGNYISRDVPVKSSNKAALKWRLIVILGQKQIIFIIAMTSLQHNLNIEYILFFEIL
jgi:hypothetical protein